jgi:hypothetical protein
MVIRTGSALGQQQPAQSQLSRKGRNYIVDRIDKLTTTFIPRNLNPPLDEFGQPLSPGYTFNLIQVNITKKSGPH